MASRQYGCVLPIHLAYESDAQAVSLLRSLGKGFEYEILSQGAMPASGTSNFVAWFTPPAENAAYLDVTDVWVLDAGGVAVERTQCRRPSWVAHVAGKNCVAILQLPPFKLRREAALEIVAGPQPTGLHCMGE